MSVKTIVCLGAGYVGGQTMAVIAEKCPELKVTVIDTDEKKINSWNSSPLPISQPNLDSIVDKCRGKNLFFTTDFKEPIEEADVIFISVGTPTKIVGHGAGKALFVDDVENAARLIGEYANKHLIVVEKSTVPVGISKMIRKIITSNSKSGLSYQILSNPEFLSEGTAISNLYDPDRILIGHELTPDGFVAASVLSSIYEHWVPKEKILTVNLWSSELSKLTNNAFLAQRLSSINSISAICEKTGANVDEVQKAICLDTRIGSKYLKASVGFGGGSFQKDLLCLVYISESLGFHSVAQYWQEVVDMNNWQRKRFVEHIIHSMFETLQNKKLTILGFAYKADTGDTRESSGIYVVDLLLKENPKIAIYDPKVTEDVIYSDLARVGNSQELLKERVTVYHDPYEAADQSHALIIITEWEEFKTYDYKKIFEMMKKPAHVFDGRNLLDHCMLKKIGFCTYGIGIGSDDD